MAFWTWTPTLRAAPLPYALVGSVGAAQPATPRSSHHWPTVRSGSQLSSSQPCNSSRIASVVSVASSVSVIGASPGVWRVAAPVHRRYLTAGSSFHPECRFGPYWSDAASCRWNRPAPPRPPDLRPASCPTPRALVRIVRWTVDAGYTALANRTDIVTGLPAIDRHGAGDRRAGPPWLPLGRSVDCPASARVRARHGGLARRQWCSCSTAERSPPTSTGSRPTRRWPSGTGWWPASTPTGHRRTSAGHLRSHPARMRRTRSSTAPSERRGQPCWWPEPATAGHPGPRLGGGTNCDASRGPMTDLGSLHPDAKVALCVLGPPDRPLRRAPS